LPRTPAIYRGPSAAVVLLLVVAREYGVLINRTKLAKLLYLADLRAVERGLPPGSGVDWNWRHYGPHSTVLSAVEVDLCRADVIAINRHEGWYGQKEVRLHLAERAPQYEIDIQFAVIVEEIVAQYGSLTATQLKDLTYQTAPMLAAQRKGEREVRLDLTGGDPYPNLAPTLHRLRAVLSAMPDQEDEPGAIEDLEREINEWADLRRAATSHLVDAE
jgi:uncharacterized phage-associated protein